MPADRVQQVIYTTGWVRCDGHRYNDHVPACNAESGVVLRVVVNGFTGEQRLEVVRYHNTEWDAEQRWLDDRGRQRGACLGNFCSEHKEVR